MQEFGRPKHTIDIGWSKMYITNILENWYKYILWYTDSGDVRMFYRSGSEWEWRSCPWTRLEDWGFSKWECIQNSSYETTTKIDYTINTFFDRLPVQNSIKNPLIFSEKFVTNKNLWWKNVVTWHEFNTTKMIDQTHIDKMFNQYTDAYRCYIWKTVYQVQNLYKNLHIPGLDMNNMVLNTQKWYSFVHDHLWIIRVQVVQMRYNGKVIDVHFANKIWDTKVFVPNIVYSDAKINSFGIYDKQLNTWPIAAKPLDYDDQVPIDYKNANFQVYWKYVDIRNLYQDMPLIKQYKKIILGI